MLLSIYMENLINLYLLFVNMIKEPKTVLNDKIPENCNIKERNISRICIKGIEVQVLGIFREEK